MRGVGFVLLLFYIRAAMNVELLFRAGSSVPPLSHSKKSTLSVVRSFNYWVQCLMH